MSVGKQNRYPSILSKLAHLPKYAPLSTSNSRDVAFPTFIHDIYVPPPQISKPAANKFSDRPPAKFRTFKTINFHESENAQFRASVITINDEYYVGLNKMWKHPVSGEWLHSKKNFFMKVAAWRELMRESVKLEDDLEIAETYSKPAQHSTSTCTKLAKPHIPTPETTFPHGMSEMLDDRTHIAMKFNVANNNVSQVKPAQKRPIIICSKPLISKPLTVKESDEDWDSPASPQPALVIDEEVPAKRPKIIPVVKQEKD